MHAAAIKVLELVSYTHITGETLTGWTQTAERILKMFKMIKYAKNGHKITKLSMQLAQTCMNFFLTHIKLVELL